MGRTPGRLRRMRAAGALVSSVFLLGLVSAPVRSCFSHPGHGGTEHGHAAAMGVPHDASPSHLGPVASSDASNSTEQGCDCLGLCQVEHSPVLSAAALGAAERDPVLPGDARPTHVAEPQPDFTYPVPLARPPPQRV